MAELIAIIVVIGVISAVATARISSGLFETRATYDKLLSQVQYARKAAIAQRRRFCVHIEATQSRLFYSDAAGTACPAAIGAAAPTGEVPFTVQVPSGITVTAVIFQFDALGRSRTAAGAALAAPQVVSVTGDGNLQFTIEHDTGYVHP